MDGSPKAMRLQHSDQRIVEAELATVDLRADIARVLRWLP